MKMTSLEIEDRCKEILKNISKFGEYELEMSKEWISVTWLPNKSTIGFCIGLARTDEKNPFTKCFPGVMCTICCHIMHLDFLSRDISVEACLMFFDLYLAEKMDK